MKSIEVMAREHALIDQVLLRLEEGARELEESGALDVEAFERLLSFFEQGVDGLHQEKEERVFLPWLATRAVGADADFVRVAAADHGTQREMLAALRGQLEGAMYGDPGALAVVAHCVRRYVQHHREHSSWESQVLFALARRILTREDDLAILHGFRRLDATRGGPLEAAREKLAEWLAQRCTPLTR